MNNFEELKEVVKKKKHKVSQANYINGAPVYLSAGIREVFLADEDEQQKLIAVITRFQNDDFGNAAEYGKESRSGHEYGRYEITSFEECEEDTAVWVHRTEDAIKVYFKFER